MLLTMGYNVTCALYYPTHTSGHHFPNLTLTRWDLKNNFLVWSIKFIINYFLSWSSCTLHWASPSHALVITLDVSSLPTHKSRDSLCLLLSDLFSCRELAKVCVHWYVSTTLPYTLHYAMFYNTNEGCWLFSSLFSSLPFFVPSFLSLPSSFHLFSFISSFLPFFFPPFLLLLSLSFILSSAIYLHLL